MPELSRNPDDYDGPDVYAHAQALNAKHDVNRAWAIGSTWTDRNEVQYAVEAFPGDCARCIDIEMAGPIEELPVFQHGARLITRTVTYGPWRYVTPEEIEAEVC